MSNELYSIQTASGAWDCDSIETDSSHERITLAETDAPGLPSFLKYRGPEQLPTLDMRFPRS